MSGKRGRPSTYMSYLKHIAEIPGNEWHIVRRGHKNRTAPSALAKRYPGFDFRAVPNGIGGFTIQARNSITHVSGREDEQ